MMTFPKPGPRPLVQIGIPSIQLTIVPRTIQVARWVQRALVSIAVGSGLLASWMCWSIQTLEQETARYAAAADRAESFNRQLTAQLEQGRLTLSAQQLLAIQEEVRFVNLLAEKRQFSWTQLLHDLEEALPPGTSIGKIQRDAKRATITIDGRAPNMGTLNTFMSTLQSRPGFGLPVLHHHKFNEAHQAGGIEFSLTVQYQALSEKAPSDDVS